MRSMPWSNTLPHLDEAPVQRASFPSTVSSTMKTKPDSDAPANNRRARTGQKASTHRIAPTAVTKFGRQPGPRRPAGQIEGRLAPQIERQDVGHALVGGVIGGALDRLGVVGIERQDERPLALAQLGVAELGGLGGELLIAVDRVAVRHGAARPPPASSPAGTWASTGLPPSVSTVRGRPRIAFSQAGSQA